MFSPSSHCKYSRKIKLREWAKSAGLIVGLLLLFILLIGAGLALSAHIDLAALSHVIDMVYGLIGTGAAVISAYAALRQIK